MKNQTTFSSSKRLFRLTGFLYLLVIICAGTSQGYIRGMLIVPGDAATTAANLLANRPLYVLGLSLDLIAFMLDAVISVLLYQLFRPYGKTLAMVSSALRLIAHPAIASINLVNHQLAYEVLHGGNYLASLSGVQLESLSMLFINAHNYGYLIAGAFFGLHCLLLGILIYRSSAIPNIFGGFLVGSALGYLLETFGNFNLPGYENYTALIVGIAAALGEVSLALYLIIVGRRNNTTP
jgi:hypothetical protein